MSVFDDVNNTQVWSANDKTVRSLVGKAKCFPHPLVPISTMIPHLAFFFSATLHNRVILCPALSVSPRLEGSFYIPLAHSSECTTETMLSPEDPEKLAMIKPFNCIKSSLRFIQMLKKQKETWNWRKWHQELQPLIPRLREVHPVPEPAGVPSDQADSPCGSPGRKRMGRGVSIWQPDTLLPPLSSKSYSQGKAEPLLYSDMQVSTCVLTAYILLLWLQILTTHAVHIQLYVKCHDGSHSCSCSENVVQRSLKSLNNLWASTPPMHQWPPRLGHISQTTYSY